MQIPWIQDKRPGLARSQPPGDGPAGRKFPQANKTRKISNLMRARRRIGFTLLAAALLLGLPGMAVGGSPVKATAVPPDFIQSGGPHQGIR
jgi:hypothetical protein